MNLSIRHILLRMLTVLSLTLGLLLAGCDKIELPAGNAGNGGANGGGNGSVTSPDKRLTPTQVLSCPTDTIVGVRGYIVGYVGGTSLSQAVFGLPEENPNTNMLLADTPDEQDISRCLIVELKKNNKAVPREELNLFDHPENYRRAIVVEGLVREYFKTTGLRDLYYYEWDDESPGGNDPAPDIPTPPGSDGDDVSPPGVDDTPQVVPDGR